MSENQSTVKDTIKKIVNKDFGIYFFTLDTKGNPTAGVATIYEHVKILRELGFNAQILHDKEVETFFALFIIKCVSSKT